MKKIIYTIVFCFLTFLINVKAQVTVTSPNGGECWLSGATRTITWTAQGLWFVNLSYSTNSGSSWISIASNVSNSGSYSWQIPQNICSKTCRVKVSDALNANIFDISNNDFSIVISQTSSPSLISPSNGSTNQNVPVTLRWNSVNCTDYYVIQVATNSSFTSPNEYYTANTSYPLQSLLPGTTHYWRVRAVNCWGTGPYSSAWSFTTTPPPSPPTLVSPSNGATNVSIRPNFSWNPSSGATSYKIQISTSSGFTTIIRERDNITSTSYQLDIDLNYSTTYYWRVNASNSAGSSGWSNVFNFTTVPPPPPTPTLNSPTNGTHFRVNQTINFSWSSSTGATSYQIQISENSEFTNIIRDQQLNINSYSAQIGESYQMKRLYWRVRAGNFSWSNWSSVWNFIILDKYEPNDNLSDLNALPAISTITGQSVDVTIQATIYPGSPQDMDFYRVYYPFSSYLNNVNLTLDNLPSNYNLYLIVNPNLWAPENFKSENDGTSPENISVSIPKGYGGNWPNFFLIYVSGFGNSNPTSPYRLRVQINQGRPVSVESVGFEIPKEFKLLNNFPNPFNPSTTIEYHLPKSSFVNLSIYNELGIKLKTLINEEQQAGKYKIAFNADDENNNLPSGVYFYQLRAGDFVETKKMILIK